MRTMTCNPQVGSCRRAVERHGRLLEILLRRLRRIEGSPILEHCDSALDRGDQANDDTISNTSKSINVVVIIPPPIIFSRNYKQLWRVLCVHQVACRKMQVGPYK